MAMITLPYPPRRAHLVSFWLTMSMLSGLVCGGLTSLLISPRWIVLGLIVTLGMALPGLLRPEVATKPYKVWNRLARTFGRGARFLLMSICYFVILVVGQTGSSIGLSRPNCAGSLWVPRRTLARETYAHQHAASTRTSPSNNWIRAYTSWALRSGNLWAVVLLPFLILLMTVEPEVRTTHPANIYTLF